MTTDESGLDADAVQFLSGGGEMGAYMRAWDWSQSSLGPPARWPQALRTAVRLMLNCGHPMYIWWGPELACLYNDAYRPSIGAERHPVSLGEPGRQVWAEIWDVIGPRIDRVLSGRGSTWDENQLIPITRDGKREDVYWTYSYSPIDDPTAPNGIGGVLVVCNETTQQIFAQRSLQAQRDRFSQLFEQAPTFMAMLSGKEHVIELANPGYLQLVGRCPVVGKSVAEALPDAVAQGYLKLLDEVFVTGKVYAANGARYAVEPVDGGPVDERYVDFVYQPIKDEAGQVVGIFVQGVDVTARAIADASLRESEARLRALNANLEREIHERSGVGGQFWQISPDLLGVLRPDGYFARANPAWLTNLGWTEAEVQAQSIFELLHPDDVEPTRGGFEHLKRGNPILRFENRYRRKDGGYHWFAWAAAPLGDAYYCSGRDITAEKEQTAVIERHTAQLDRVWRNSRDIQVVIGSDGIFQSVNQAWTQILGHDPVDIAGRSFLDFIWPEDANLTQSGLHTAVAVENLSNFENRYIHKDGTLRWISWHTAREGGIVYGYGRDITAEKLARAELAQAHDELRQAQKMEAVGQLTGGIAHDFNNLLTGISGSLEILEKRMTAGRLVGLDRYINAAQSGARRAASLTQRLLAFSRRQTLDPRPTDINQLVHGMGDLIRRSVGPTVELEIVGAGGLWMTRVDPSQLENSLLNLCINARDAMAPGGGRLTIETANKWLDDRQAKLRELTPGQYVSLCVTDTGTGMDTETIARAFDPFFTTKPLGEGTGLGLSMVYGFVRQSGGQVRVYSELGKGTTMCLYLPRYIGDAVEVPEDKPEGIDPGDGESVLIVDDEVLVRMLLVEVLEENGYRVIEAQDGRSALRVIESDVRIDLLITDVGLPHGLNGRQLADAARQLRPDLKVLFITGYAENAVLGNGHLEAGMEVVTKPFVMSSLGNKIRDLIDRPPRPQ